MAMLVRALLCVHVHLNSTQKDDALHSLKEVLRKSRVADDSKQSRIFEAIVSFQEVRHACFATVRRRNYKNALSNFRKAILRIGSNRISTKVCNF